MTWSSLLGLHKLETISVCVCLCVYVCVGGERGSQRRWGDGEMGERERERGMHVGRGGVEEIDKILLMSRLMDGWMSE